MWGYENIKEMKRGYAEGIGRTESRLNIIDATLNFFNKKIDELERRVEELENWR